MSFENYQIDPAFIAEQVKMFEQFSKQKKPTTQKLDNQKSKAEAIIRGTTKPAAVSNKRKAEAPPPLEDEALKRRRIEAEKSFTAVRKHEARLDRVLSNPVLLDKNGKTAREDGYIPPSQQHLDLSDNIADLYMKFLEKVQELTEDKFTEISLYPSKK